MNIKILGMHTNFENGKSAILCDGHLGMNEAIALAQKANPSVEHVATAIRALDDTTGKPTGAIIEGDVFGRIGDDDGHMWVRHVGGLGVLDEAPPSRPASEAVH